MPHSLFGLDAQVRCEAYACDVVRGELFPSAFLLSPLCVCVCVCVFIKLHITTQSGPVILVILCHSVCVCVYLLNCT